VDLKELLKLAVEKKASDLHLTENSPPILRIDGRLVITDKKILTREELKKCIYGVLSDVQKEKFERDKELDFSLEFEGIDRFRVNVHLQKGSVEAALRRIPLFIPSINDLGLPPSVIEFSRRPNGLVLITGPTGSGKTTSLAAMIQLINEENPCMIICVEDPIEYMHNHNKALVEQREVGMDTKSFGSALRVVLRQNPDIILVGEMRDLETISAAITAAETGHLVISTLHTTDAAQAIDRIVDVFPPHQQSQIRLQLSMVLQGVVAQQLLPKKDKTGIVPVAQDKMEKNFLGVWS